MIAESTRKAAGQVLLVGFPGHEPPNSLLEAADRGALGGFVLFKRNLGDASQVAELCGRLIAACPAAEPPFVAIDQEGGRVQRLGPPVLQLPPMRAFGQLDDPALTEEAAHLLGRQLSALGFNLDFAPVLDVVTGELSPAIGDRSFGSDPALVVRHGRAFARGLERAGVAACGKHFPGHGDTTLDSHFELPTVTHAREHLSRVELAPFASLARELGMLMTAHIVFSALDAERPATLSPAVLRTLLREELGFDGLLVSDDFEMKAISKHVSVPDAACQAIAAGCDALLVCSDPELCEAVASALAERADRDATFAAQLELAAQRTLRARLLRPPRALAGAELSERLLTLEARAFETRIAQALR